MPVANVVVAAAAATTTAKTGSVQKMAWTYLEDFEEGYEAAAMPPPPSRYRRMASSAAPRVFLDDEALFPLRWLVLYALLVLMLVTFWFSRSRF